MLLCINNQLGAQLEMMFVLHFHFKAGLTNKKLMWMPNASNICSTLRSGETNVTCNIRMEFA